MSGLLSIQRIAYWLIGLVGPLIVLVGIGVAMHGVLLVVDEVKEPTAPTEADVIECINKNRSARRSARVPAEFINERCRRRYESDVTSKVKLKGDLSYGLFCGNIFNQSHDWIVTRVGVKVRYQTLSFDGEISSAWLRPENSSYLCVTFPEHWRPPIIDTALSPEEWGWDISAVYGVRLAK
jgi:hypothetical protein